METRRDFLKKTALLSGSIGLANSLPASIRRAMAIDPAPGSTYLDAEHIVILMQENRSFDHCFGTLQGVRGFNDPRAISLPGNKPVWLQANERGETYAPFRLDIKDTKITWMGSLPHSRASQVDAHNLGKYDKWLAAKKSGNKKYANMPLTLGYYNRQDLPFNYAMADAFTICDQNFCSAMTSTTPNRSFFWTGKIMSEENNLPKANIRNDDYQFGKQQWKTFPELLQENGIGWKFYQNEITCGGGFKDQESSWLGNFGCNLLEFFEAFNVQFTPKNITRIKNLIETLPGEIDHLQETNPSSEEAAEKNKKAVAKKQEVLANAKADLQKWSEENFEKLPAEQKQLFYNAFVVNKADENYRRLATLNYYDNGKQRAMEVPAGDVLYQLRKEVNEGKLPAVSWVTPPQNFSDHPSAPWYGAWYISEVLDILTKNPEVWKKTIFIVTYDENDGYYDHVPPFVVPDLAKPGTGKCSEGISSEVEYVRLANELAQGIEKKAAREGPVGMGFRVPMIIASPWSRGGKVCSQLFEHTSTLQFLEKFFNTKSGKKIHLDNISEWRRAVSGDLTSVFSPFEPTLERLPFLERDQFVEQIYDARFKQEPSAYKALNAHEINEIIATPSKSKWMPRQENGMRKSCALPYELYADGRWLGDKNIFEITMKAGNEVFKDDAQGSPFTVYVPKIFTDDKGQSESFRYWHFAVKAGDALDYNWPLPAFENNQYHTRVHAPNGFYREFIGDKNNPLLDIIFEYERSRFTKSLTGNALLKIVNSHSSKDYVIEIID
ncbi:MAG: phospholipase C, phosphocholine-specific, partial [Ginsengibacter sp.]